MADTLGVSTFAPQLNSTTAFTAVAASTALALTGYKSVRIAVTAQGLWVKFGTSGVTATAGTASEIFIPPNWTYDIMVPAGAIQPAGTVTHLAYIQDAASAKGSISLY